MPERLTIHPSQTRIKPTRVAACHPDSIAELRPFFEKGQGAVDRLDPVLLIQDPHDIDEQWLYDGNHRLTLGRVYQLLVPAMLYVVGETIDSLRPPMEVNNSTPAWLKWQRQLAEEKGFNSFADLGRLLR